MPIITLTSDYGTKDSFVSALKGSIYTAFYDAKIVDISHEISPFDIVQASYVLNNSYEYFPEKTIHIISVNAEVKNNNSILVVFFNNHYFIGSDSGIFSLICKGKTPEFVFEITEFNDLEDTIFPSADIFSKVVGHICKEKNLNLIGKKINYFNKISTLEISISHNKILGTVIYIDNFGNVVCNITKEIFDREIGEKDFVINARNYTFDKIYNKYCDIEKEKSSYGNHDGKALVVFNSSGFLEIAIYKSNRKTVGGASSLLGLKFRDSINISF